MKIIKALVMVLCFGLCQSVLAAELNGSKPLLCVPLAAVECVAGKACQSGSAESVNLPQFLRIDFKQKTVSGVRPNETKANSKIENIKVVEDALVLQGVENGRGWSISINQGTGKMVGTASGNEVGFIVYGACTVL